MSRAIAAVVATIKAGALDEHAELCESFAKALTKGGYGKVSAEDVSEWVEPQGVGDASKVEKAVEKLLGKKTLEHYESLARVINVVGYRLKIPGWPKTAGGVDLSKSYD